jgi:polysaccharide export outer membrane protein
MKGILNIRTIVLLVCLGTGGYLPAQIAESLPSGSASFTGNISVKDLVHIKVFQEDDLESTLRVAPDGTITFPLVGVVRVAGKTPQQAASSIREMLKDGYIRNPQVSLTVTEHFKRRFTVLGQVQKPGAYELPDQDNITLLEAVGMAGGYTSIADKGKVILKRRTGEKESIYKINAKAMASGAASSAFIIQPDDVITVAESLF